jgi:hypothetical protein
MIDTHSRHYSRIRTYEIIGEQQYDMSPLIDVFIFVPDPIQKKIKTITLLTALTS